MSSAYLSLLSQERLCLDPDHGVSVSRGAVTVHRRQRLGHRGRCERVTGTFAIRHYLLLRVSLHYTSHRENISHVSSFTANSSPHRYFHSLRGGQLLCLPFSAWLISCLFLFLTPVMVLSRFPARHDPSRFLFHAPCLRFASWPLTSPAFCYISQS